MMHSICHQIWKTQQWPQDGKRSVFIPIPKKGNAKVCSNYCTIALISYTSNLSSVIPSCSTLCEPMDCSTPGFLVHYQILRFTQTHVHRVGDAIQLSHPLLSPSLPAFSLSQHQSLFKWDSSLHQVDKLLELQLQHQSFQWIFRTDFL